MSSGWAWDHWGAGQETLTTSPGPRVMGGFGLPAIDPDMPLRQQPLNGPARDAGKLAPQEGVQPFQRKRLLDGDFVSQVQRMPFDLGDQSSPPPALRHSQLPALASGAGGAGAADSSRETRMSSPTPTQMALSATLKAGKPISAPPRVKR